MSRAQRIDEVRLRASQANEDEQFEDDDYDNDDYDDYEEVGDENEKVKIQSLFDENMVFDSVQALFKYEFEKNHFNLLRIVKKYNMDMMAYIRMINYIRHNVNLSL